MFRVSSAEDSTRTVVTVEGQLIGGQIEVLEATCDQAMAKGKPVELFLRDVSEIDTPCRALLCRLAAKGVRLLASGVYTEYVVREAAYPRSRSTQG